MISGQTVNSFYKKDQVQFDARSGDWCTGDDMLGSCHGLIHFFSRCHQAHGAKVWLKTSRRLISL